MPATPLSTNPQFESIAVELMEGDPTKLRFIITESAWYAQTKLFVTYQMESVPFNYDPVTFWTTDIVSTRELAWSEQGHTLPV